MTISSETRKAGPYAGNGSTTSFPFAFKVFYAGDVLVVHTDPDGVESTLQWTTHYHVLLSSNQDASPGGHITMLSAPDTGEKITITSRVQNKQPLDLTNQGGFYPRVINDALDRLTILVQQIAEQVSRALTVSISSGADPGQVLQDVFTAAEDADQANQAVQAALGSIGALSDLASANVAGAVAGNTLVRAAGGWEAGPININNPASSTGTLNMNRGGIGQSLTTTADAGLPLVVSNQFGTPMALPDQLSSAGIADLAVSSAKLAGNAVTSSKVADGAVGAGKIADGAVTYSKIQDVTNTNRLLGRASAGAGVIEEIPCTASGRALLAGNGAGAQRATLGVPAVTSGSWSPSSYTGFSVDPSITFNWERVGDTVTVRVASATVGTSSTDAFTASGDMPAEIIPSGTRSVMIPVRVTAHLLSATHSVLVFVGILQISDIGEMAFNVPVSVGDGTSRDASQTNLALGSGSATSGGANAKGLVPGSCFTYLL